MAMAKIAEYREKLWFTPAHNIMNKNECDGRCEGVKTPKRKGGDAFA